MKRITSILLLLALLFSLTGVQLCIDYCSNEIESIHFGEVEKSCHHGNCGMDMQSDCCTSDQVDVKPQLLDYTLSELVSLDHKNEMYAFGPTVVVAKFEIQGSSYLTLLIPDIPVPKVDIRDLTQVTLC